MPDTGVKRMTNENEVVKTEVTNQQGENPQAQRSPSALEDVQQKLAEKEVKEAQPEPSPEPEKVDEGVEPTETKAGDKTDPNLLLKSLQEERAIKKELKEKLAEKEEELNQLRTSTSSEDDEVYTDEGKALKKQIDEIKNELSASKKKNELLTVISNNPSLKEHETEFQEFLNDSANKGLSIDRAAKVFIVEKGLDSVQRSGLEKSTGGDRKPASTGTMSHEDVERLRKTDFRKYQEMLQKGQIKMA